MSRPADRRQRGIRFANCGVHGRRNGERIPGRAHDDRHEAAAEVARHLRMRHEDLRSLRPPARRSHSVFPTTPTIVIQRRSVRVLRDP